MHAFCDCGMGFDFWWIYVPGRSNRDALCTPSYSGFRVSLALRVLYSFACVLRFCVLFFALIHSWPTCWGLPNKLICGFTTLTVQIFVSLAQFLCTSFSRSKALTPSCPASPQSFFSPIHCSPIWIAISWRSCNTARSTTRRLYSSGKWCSSLQLWNYSFYSLSCVPAQIKIVWSVFSWLFGLLLQYLQHPPI